MKELLQESRAVTRKPRDAAALLFGLKFVDNTQYKFKSSQASKAICFTAPNIVAQNKKCPFKVIQGHVFWSQWKGDKGLRV